MTAGESDVPTVVVGPWYLSFVRRALKSMVVEMAVDGVVYGVAELLG